MWSDNLTVFACAIHLVSQGCHCIADKAQEAYLSQRVRALTMLGSELQDRVNKLQGSVQAGMVVHTCSVMFQLVACSRTTCICMLAGLVVLMSVGSIFW